MIGNYENNSKIASDTFGKLPDWTRKTPKKTVN